jgi:proton-translocating NAD(P)+ transhydrogenase subunit alpha
MQIAVRRERERGEQRVALVPESVRRLIANGFTVAVESGAAPASVGPDAEYQAAGATIAPSRDELLAAADLLVTIHAPGPDEIERLRRGAALVGLLFPRTNVDLVRTLAARGITAIALDAVPRTTLAQTMDALSSQATAAGYRAVILAASALPRFFPMLVTAAGTIPPARVLVLGAGVAGLQAIATARRLGAVVEAFDVRRAVKEEIESLGARFVDVELPEDAGGAGAYAREIGEESRRRISAVLGQRLAQADVCITTALVPGRPAPRLVTADMVQGMRPGSVIVDLAAEQGGNCELTEPGKEAVHHGVTIIGPVNAAADVAVHASQMYSRNVEKLLLHLWRGRAPLGRDPAAHAAEGGALALDLDDPIARACVVTHAGQVLERPS